MAQRLPPACSRFARDDAAWLFCWLFSAWWVLLLVFNIMPSIDIFVSKQFFAPQDCPATVAAGRTCGGFVTANNPISVAVRKLSLQLPYAVVVFLVGMLVRSWWLDDRIRFHQRRRDTALSLMTFALGSGVLVNGILKAFWGRPRPRDTDMFGGRFDFIQAGSGGGKCLDNCSFISGEAATAGWLFCLIWLLPPRLRLPLGIPIALLSVALTGLRIANGAHFLSDVVLGWLSSPVIFVGLLAVSQFLSSPEAPRLRNAPPSISK